MVLRIISDCHGQTRKYREIAEAAEYSVQTGDLGFADTYKALMDDSSFSVEHHKWFGGNHDDYDFITLCEMCEHNAVQKSLVYKHYERFNSFNLGDYGMRSHGGVDFYIVRGAFSIDVKPRLQQERLFGVRSWWVEEELSIEHHDSIVDDFAKAKPDVVLTHECPQNVGHDGVLKTNWILENFGFDPLTFTTNTGILLQRMFEEHQPKLWVFGHYHKNWRATVNGTEFVCLPELGYLDI